MSESIKAICPTCGSECGIYGSDEGTNSFIPLTESLQSRNTKLTEALAAIRQWDMLDSAADGNYWKGELDKVLKDN